MADLRVMSWNVQNLFPSGHPQGPATDEELSEAGSVGRGDRCRGTGRMALQEVGPPEVLSDLDDVCSTNFEFRLAGIADDRGIRVALLSSRLLSDRRDMTEFPSGVLPVQWRDARF